MIDGLDAQQLEAVTCETTPLRIIAPAGSGKTRVLTRRIAHQSETGAIEPQHTLALTFTRKAANELTERLWKLGLRDAVTAGTFHAVALGQLRDRRAERGQAEPTVLDNRYRLVARVLNRADFGVRAPLVTAEIDWAKARLIDPIGYPDAARAAGRPTAANAETIAEIFAQYEDECRARRVVDFDDLLGQCIREIDTDPGWAQAQRWRFRHLFVDEFQDVNPLQFRLLQAWLGPRESLCVVGDPDQAIYAWNGADASYLVDFAHHFPGAQTISLKRNYRSTASILGVASSILESGHHSTPALADEGPIPTLTTYDTDEGELQGVIRRILERRGPSRPLSHHAILARTNSQLEVAAAALQRAGIRSRIRTRAALADKPAVAAMISEYGNARGSLLILVEDLADEPQPLAAVAELARERLEAEPTARISEFLTWLATPEADAAVSEDGAATTARARGGAVDLATFHAAKGLEWPVVHLIGLEAGYVPISHAKTPAATAEEQRLLYVAITRARQELHCSWAKVRRFDKSESRRQASPWLEPLAGRIRLLNHTREAIDPTAYLERNRERLRNLDSDDPIDDHGAIDITNDFSDLDEPEIDGEENPGPLAEVIDLRGGTTIDLTAPAAADTHRATTISATADTGGVASEAHTRANLASLEAWRADAARAARVSTHAVIDDHTLAAIAEAAPTNLDDLARIDGVSRMKLARLGPAILEAITTEAVIKLD